MTIRPTTRISAKGHTSARALKHVVCITKSSGTYELYLEAKQNRAAR